MISLSWMEEEQGEKQERKKGVEQKQKNMETFCIYFAPKNKNMYCSRKKLVLFFFFKLNSLLAFGYSSPLSVHGYSVYEAMTKATYCAHCSTPSSSFFGILLYRSGIHIYIGHAIALSSREKEVCVPKKENSTIVCIGDSILCTFSKTFPINWLLSRSPSLSLPPKK